MGKRLRTYLKQQMVTKQMETINDNNEQQSQQQQPTHIFFSPTTKQKKLLHMDTGPANLSFPIGKYGEGGEKWKWRGWKRLGVIPPNQSQ